MSYKFCAKAVMNVEEILERKSKGLEFFELHANYQTLYGEYKNVLNEMDKNNVYFKVIHAPYYDNVNGEIIFTGISSVNDEVNKKSVITVKDTINLANKLLKTDDRYLVVHPAQHLDLNHDFDNIYFLETNEKNKKIREARQLSINNTVKNLKELLPLCEELNITLCLENFMSFDGLNNPTSFCSYAYIEDFLELFEIVDNAKLGMTFDVCHMIMQARLMRMMYKANQLIGCNLPEIFEKYIDIIKSDDYEILLAERYLEKLGPKIGVVHLNNTLDHGMTMETHSYKYCDKEKDIKFLTRFFNKLKEIDYKNIITLEINDEDYFHTVNLSETYNTIKKVLGI